MFPASSRILLFALLVTLAPLTGGASAQCDTPQGNATLGIGGLAEPGSSLSISLSGKPNAPFLLAVDVDDGPFSLAGGGQVCLAQGFQILFNGFTQPLFSLAPWGSFETIVTIPPDPVLVGTTFYFQGFVYDPSSPVGFFAISNMVARTIHQEAPVASIFFEDFEAGWNSWWVTNGIWEVGSPAKGTMSGYQSAKCAATKLSGNYPDYSSSRIVSPPFALPTVQGDEVIQLNYQTWFNFNGGDSGWVQVSSDFGATWQSPSCATSKTGYGSVWAQCCANLTSFAGQTIVLGFGFSSDCCNTAQGFLVDDVHVFKGVPVFDSFEDWESGLGYWWCVSNGCWEVGVPTAGPTSVPSGVQCVGTVLGGNYPDYKGTKLVSPPVTIPDTALPRLWFTHWFSFNGGDSGQVQISLDDGCSWTVLQSYVGTSGGAWTPTNVILSAYEGQTVRFAFNLATDCCNTSTGWYIDDIRIQ